MNAGIRNIRVYWRLKGKGNARFIIGQYHPNVQSVYVTAEQVERICKRYKCAVKDIVPFGNVAKVEVIMSQNEDGKCGWISRVL